MSVNGRSGEVGGKWVKAAEVKEGPYGVRSPRGETWPCVFFRNDDGELEDQNLGRLFDLKQDCEFIAIPSPSELSALVACAEKLRAISDIINETRGVAGWHLNGAEAKWGEFEVVDEIDAALQALAEARKVAK